MDDGATRKMMRRFEHDHCARFLTFSTYRRLPLFANDAICGRFADCLAATHERKSFHLYAWVVMPEHVHLLLWPNQETAQSILTGLKRSFAREVIARWRSLEAPILSQIKVADGGYRFWQRGGGYDRNLRDNREFIDKFEYVHENPVKRGLASSPEEYRWSSARWFAGDRSGPIQVDRTW